MAAHPPLLINFPSKDFIYLLGLISLIEPLGIRVQWLVQQLVRARARARRFQLELMVPRRFRSGSRPPRASGLARALWGLAQQE